MADSDEDVLPVWLREHLGVMQSRPAKDVAIRNVALPSGLKREYLKPERIQDMSGLQDKAKPIMLPLIDATRTAGLKPTECALLGSWGAVTGIMLEYHARNVVDEQRRSAVYGDVEHHSPAPKTAVFLTRVMPVDLEAAIGTLLLRTKEDQRAQVQCEIFTARSLRVPDLPRRPVSRTFPQAGSL